MTKSVNDLHHTLTYMVRAVVDTPDESCVFLEADETGVRFLICVAPGDAGKVIGKQGRTVTALRRLMLSAAKPLNLQVTVDVERPANTASVVPATSAQSFEAIAAI